MKIITEEMRFRKRLCEFALKYGVTKAAKRYHTNRQFVYRQLEKYDGTLRSLALQSRKPHSHPNAHTKEELTLIKQIYSRYGCDGLAEVYVQLRKRGYKRSYGSMLKQIKKIPKEKVKIRKGYTRHKEIRGQYPGDKVQVDIKYVPKECLLFDTIDKKYYQITAIDEFSRKRILEIVDEKSVTNTSKFIRTLEEKMGLKINTIQTDNGPEFVNNQIETNLPTLFELTLKDLGMIHRRTRPYSPWQNGKVERSHKIDGERFYSRNEFTSEEDLKKKLKRYNARYNNIAKKVFSATFSSIMILSIGSTDKRDLKVSNSTFVNRFTTIIGLSIISLFFVTIKKPCKFINARLILRRSRSDSVNILSSYLITLIEARRTLSSTNPDWNIILVSKDCK